MYMNKYHFVSIVRKLGLIRVSDLIRFCICFANTYHLRRRFFAENINVKLPPAYYIYETFNLDYQSFYNKGLETANWLVDNLSRHKKIENITILDWGCGPGRIIRHLPNVVPTTCSLYGSDYNISYIKWCKKNIPEVTFKENKLLPPLDFKNNFFDVVYGISIFTHLSEEMHYRWFSELLRVTRPGGIIFITLQGGVFKTKLLDSQILRFDKGELIVKANTKEGHRTFCAFHPTSFVKKLIGNNEILEHVPGVNLNRKFQQDIWIIKKV